MKLLPNDIHGIIYRYVFDYNYKLLIQQYNEKFLLHWRTDCFVAGNKRYIANWRNIQWLSGTSLKFPIFRFVVDDVVDIGDYKRKQNYNLPKNYFNTVLY